MKWIVTTRAQALADLIATELPGSSAEIGRAAGERGHMVLLSVANDEHDAAIDAFLAAPEPKPKVAPVQFVPQPSYNASTDPSGLFRGTKARISFYTRNGVAWLASRSWGNASKKADVQTLKAAKAALDPGMIEAAASDLASVLALQVGRDHAGVCVTHVACGHSKRPDCFACQVAQAVAQKLGLTFRKVFKDRFVKGVSHPKEFKDLPPIELEALPAEPFVLVVDDVATSGWHMEEALKTLRDAGVLASGVAWISGNVE